jgi:ABC-type nickel/cobalt efflux system permease component RcnA
MDSNLITLLAGAFLLSCLHGLIPNHWAPFVVLGRDRQWDSGRIALVTLVGGAAHLSSTVLIGVAIGVAGYALTLWYEAVMRWAAPVILVAAGLWILRRGDHRHGRRRDDEPSRDDDHPEHCDDESCHVHHPEHSHFHFGPHDLATIGTLCAVMFLSPCLELETYYAVAARRGWLGIATVSVIYMVVTVAVMTAMAGFAAKSLEQVRWPFLARHEHKISGGLLIALGLVWLAFPL